MTITHPHHPLYQQRVEVLHIRRGADPDLIVRLPNGRHVAVVMSWTDYAGVTEPPAMESSTLLALAGLRQVVRLLDHGHQEPHYDEGSST